MSRCCGHGAVPLQARLFLWMLLLSSVSIERHRVSAASSHLRTLSLSSKETTSPEVTPTSSGQFDEETSTYVDDEAPTTILTAIDTQPKEQQHLVEQGDKSVGAIDSLVETPSTPGIQAVQDATVTAAPPSGKKYSFIKAVCNDRFMTIQGTFKEHFKGRIYALGYPDEPECGFSTVNVPDLSENVTFSLPLGQCGVRMRTTEDDIEKPKPVNPEVYHDASIYIQYSAFLQQAVDEKLSLSCLEERKRNNEEIWTGEAESIYASEPQLPSRRGRKLKDVGVKSSMPKLSTKIGEAWMEIIAGKDPTPKSKKHSPVSVGEEVTIVVSAKVNRGFDARIVNCTAHDGSRVGSEGSRAQQILDSAGCSVDKNLVPNFRRRRLPVETRNRLTTLHFATFPAFKFPERDHLHIKCSVAYCQGPCPQETCDSGTNHFGTWREKYGRLSQVLVETSEIVNSVEVIAPDLDETGGHHYERHQSGGSFPMSAESGGSSGRGFTDSQQLFFSPPINPLPTSNTGAHHAPPPNINGGQQQQQQQTQQQSYWTSMKNTLPPSIQHPPNAMHSVCISPGTVILALVILGIILVISATVTLWFALKRSELKKMHMKHAFHNPSPYYRFNQHW